ncbi:SLOG family protein [Streptococcus hongkongensis]|nr:hypothetical protein NC01_03610 [Streptococcus uberis]
MTAILISGYRASDLGIFQDKDKRIPLIKKAIKKDIIAYIEDGVDWFIFTGNLGFEFWVLEVCNELKSDYPINLATIFIFEDHGKSWNDTNQEKLVRFNQVNFVKYCFPSYKNPEQFKQYNQFLADNTDQAFLFYDEENVTNLKYLVNFLKDRPNYFVNLLTFDRLNELIED